MSERTTLIKSNTLDPAEVVIVGATKLTMRVDDFSTASVAYLGYAPIGSSEADPVWQIVKMDESGTPTTLKSIYAGGGAFTQVWNDRTSLNYS